MQPEANSNTSAEDNSYGLVRATRNKCLHIHCGGYCLSNKKLTKGIFFFSFLLCVLVPEIGASLKTSSGCPGTADPELTVPPKSNSCWGGLMTFVTPNGIYLRESGHTDYNWFQRAEKLRWGKIEVGTIYQRCSEEDDTDNSYNGTQWPGWRWTDVKISTELELEMELRRPGNTLQPWHKPSLMSCVLIWRRY